MASKTTFFNYIASNETTGIVKGELRAQGHDAAINQLERMGLKPISVSKNQPRFLIPK